MGKNLQIAMGMKLAVVVAIVLSVWSLAVAMEESSDAMDKLVDSAANRLPSHLSDDQIQMFTRLLQQKLKQRGNDNTGAENDLGESARTERILLTNTDQACVPQEGKDHQEDCVASRVLRVQVQVSRCSGSRQALRACRCRQWKAQEEELDIAQKCRYLALDVLGLLLSFIAVTQ